MSEYAFAGRDCAWANDTQERGPVRRDASGARRGRDGTRYGRRAGVLAFGLAAAGFLAVALAVGLAVPLTRVTRAFVAEPCRISADELLSWAGVAPGANWFRLDERTMSKNAAAHPRIAKVSARKVFPNAVAFELTERTAAAIVYARGADGRLEAHCVDGEGVVFAALRDEPGAAELPVLSGLEIRGLRYGMRLGPSFAKLLASVAELGRSEPGLLRALSEIRAIAADGVLTEAILYPAHYRLPVRIKPVLSADMLRSMMLVLDVVHTGGLASRVLELDFRSDTYVYKLKEAVSG